MTIFDEINFIRPARRETIPPYGLQLYEIAEEKPEKIQASMELEPIPLRY